MPTGVLAEILGADGLIVIAVIVIVLLFGGSQLPKLARGLGSASHEFKKGIEEGDPTKGADSTPSDAKAPDQAAGSAKDPGGS
ncbi:MAG TPA: twin-arginine translocase TatA/TatE family subunit [Acidimicrobiales bacterium]|nr:twin-arginine translocase TatA/TatE family subunit [Acidimicrobiales bacterium]